MFVLIAHAHVRSDHTFKRTGYILHFICFTADVFPHPRNDVVEVCCRRDYSRAVTRVPHAFKLVTLSSSNNVKKRPAPVTVYGA